MPSWFVEEPCWVGGWGRTNVSPQNVNTGGSLAQPQPPYKSWTFFNSRLTLRVASSGLFAAHIDLFFPHDGHIR